MFSFFIPLPPYKERYPLPALQPSTFYGEINKISDYIS